MYIKSDYLHIFRAGSILVPFASVNIGNFASEEDKTSLGDDIAPLGAYRPVQVCVYVDQPALH